MIGHEFISKQYGAFSCETQLTLCVHLQAIPLGGRKYEARFKTIILKLTLNIFQEVKLVLSECFILCTSRNYNNLWILNRVCRLFFIVAFKKLSFFYLSRTSSIRS